MSRLTKNHRFQTVIALDCNYMPMVEMSRRKALKALATGRAQALDLRDLVEAGAPGCSLPGLPRCGLREGQSSG